MAIAVHDVTSEMFALQLPENLTELERLQEEHPIWNSRLVRACSQGILTKQDFRLIFSQYFRYSQNFTRYLAALMANCENDYFRSLLSENLWEEGGGADPASRHAELFRHFLKDTLHVDIESLQFQSFAEKFFCQYLDFCRNSTPMAGSAFLSLGTEAIIPRLYGYFCDGLLKAGIAEKDLRFFRIHMECDDQHAVTLMRLVRSYSHEPSWLEQCKHAVNLALNIRHQFFEDVFDFVLQERLADLLGRVRSGASLIPASAGPAAFVHSPLSEGSRLLPLYSNEDKDLNIEFFVQRVDFGAEVLDVRLVKIPPRHNNECHRHPHESLLTVTKGIGRITVGDFAIEVSPGDTVFVPRWTLHQTQNTSDECLELLAVTDYGLTRRACLGENLGAIRMKPQNDADSKNTVLLKRGINRFD